jgi:hypothetical protein
MLVQDVFDVALGDRQALVGQLGGEFAHGQVLELFRIKPVQVGLDALALGHPGRVWTIPGRQSGLPVLWVFGKVVACRNGSRSPGWPAARKARGRKGGTPYPDACRVLEGMLPPWTADDLFSPPRSSKAPG